MRRTTSVLFRRIPWALVALAAAAPAMADTVVLNPGIIAGTASFSGG